VPRTGFPARLYRRAVGRERLYCNGTRASAHLNAVLTCAWELSVPASTACSRTGRYKMLPAQRRCLQGRDRRTPRMTARICWQSRSAAPPGRCRQFRGSAGKCGARKRQGRAGLPIADRLSELVGAGGRITYHVLSQAPMSGMNRCKCFNPAAVRVSMTAAVTWRCEVVVSDSCRRSFTGVYTLTSAQGPSTCLRRSAAGSIIPVIQLRSAYQSIAAGPDANGPTFARLGTHQHGHRGA